MHEWGPEGARAPPEGRHHRMTSGLELSGEEGRPEVVVWSLRRRMLRAVSPKSAADNQRDAGGCAGALGGARMRSGRVACEPKSASAHERQHGRSSRPALRAAPSAQICSNNTGPALPALRQRTGDCLGFAARRPIAKPFKRTNTAPPKRSSEQAAAAAEVSFGW